MLIVFALTSTLPIHAYANLNSCKSFSDNSTICAPSKDWILFKDFEKDGKAGQIWLNKNRQGKEVNSVTLLEDKFNSFKNWESYVFFARSQFEKRLLKVVGHKNLGPNKTILKIATPDEKNYFYQAYIKRGGRTWTFSCAGPSLSLLDRDCMSFVRSIN